VNILAGESQDSDSASLALIFLRMKKVSESVQSWRISKLAGKARQLTVLEAKSAEDAVKRYAKENGITDTQERARLEAQ
jgi:hypothetical protein